MIVEYVSETLRFIHDTYSNILSNSSTYYPRGDSMASYVAPEIREKFETLSVDLKNDILERNVQLNTIYDLIAVLEVISRGE